MAVFNEPTKWQTSLVNSGDANVIPQSTPVGTGEASFDDGFPQITQIPIGAGGIAPDRKDFNGLFKILGDWIFYAQNGGLPTYSADFDYIVGRVVLYTDGNLYKCIQANGVSSTVVTPDSNTAYWQRLDNFVRSVNGVNADTQGNVQLNGLVKSVNGVNADASGNVTVKSSLNVDYTAGIDVPAPISTQKFTAPCDGIYVTITHTNNGLQQLYINDVLTAYGAYDSASNEFPSSLTIPLSKGDVIYWGRTNKVYTSTFYPFK